MSMIKKIINASNINPDWEDIIKKALASMDQVYLEKLIEDQNWYPGPNNLLAAFRQSPRKMRYILFGESPYPRKESANGFAFHDAKINNIWSETGLDKEANKATSLRNIIKTMLIAEGHLDESNISQESIAKLSKVGMVQDMNSLFKNFSNRGILLLNATPVFHLERKPAQDLKQWIPFYEFLLKEIRAMYFAPPTLILWGNLAKKIEAMPISEEFPKLVAEHPYNVSFIKNKEMQGLFRGLKLLQGKDLSARYKTGCRATDAVIY